MPILNGMSMILQSVVNNIYPGPCSLALLSSHQYVQRIQKRRGLKDKEKHFHLKSGKAVNASCSLSRAWKKESLHVCHNTLAESEVLG